MDFFTLDIFDLSPFDSMPSVAVNPFLVDLDAFLNSALSMPVEFQLVPQGDIAYPAISYSLIDSDSDYRLSGPSGIKNDLCQFDAWSTNPLDCAIASESLRSALQGFVGTMGTTTVLTCNLHNQFSRRYNPVSNDDLPLHKITSEYTIIYRTSVKPLTAQPGPIPFVGSPSLVTKGFGSRRLVTKGFGFG